MHEFAIAQDIVTSLSNNLQEDFLRISKINIEVGTFSGVVTDSLSFGLEALFKESKIEGVKINISENETTAVCECGKDYLVKDIFDLCPHCGSTSRDISDGTEISVTSVEIKEE
ncbi:MAG: hydrogenase maturation nickel metallochaperone HypA [Acidobacteriota bacterium]